MLPANNLTQIDVSVRGRQVQASTTRYLYINIVDSEFHQLFKNWLVAVKIEEPVITKVSSDFKEVSNKFHFLFLSGI